MGRAVRGSIQRNGARVQGVRQDLAPASFTELVQFAQMAAKSQLVPKEYRNQPEDIMLAVQLGSEVGLRPMQSLQNIAVINGRPAVWGDALPGLCKASPVYDDIIETWEHEQDAELLTAVCIAKRHGSTPVTARFSGMDAKRAGLWTKAGPWQTYPRRMLQMRPPRSPHNSIVRCQSLGKMREQPSGRAHLRTPPDRTRSPSKLLIEAVGARRYSTSQSRLFAAAQSPAARAGS